jgi:hypothetical protein
VVFRILNPKYGSIDYEFRCTDYTYCDRCRLRFLCITNKGFVNIEDEKLLKKLKSTTGWRWEDVQSLRREKFFRIMSRTRRKFKGNYDKIIDGK